MRCDDDCADDEGEKVAIAVGVTEALVAEVGRVAVGVAAASILLPFSYLCRHDGCVALSR